MVSNFIKSGENMSLTKQEIDLAVERSIESLDEVVGGVASGPRALKNYFDTVGVDNIKGEGVKKRIVRKMLAPSSALLKKLLQGYLEQRTEVDNMVRDTLYMQQRELTQLRNEFRQVMQQDAYETQKLIDGFKKEVIAELVDLKTPSSTGTLNAQVIHAERVNTLRRVNVGCGRDLRDDYINVDSRKIEGVDMVADARALPFKKDTLDEVFASHVLEHFTERDGKKILQHWYDLLKKNGELRIIVPNIDAMTKRYAGGELTWDALRSVVLGGQDYASDHHFNQFSPDSLESLVKSALPTATFTFQEVSRDNGESVEMEMVIEKV
jgi:SAM-dependent methyltransferase